MKTVKIGKQVWTKRNLKVDHYRNGDVIPQVQDPEEWSKLTTGAWCYYNHKKEKRYGKLYNWYAVNDPRGLAPKGYHIPTYEDFLTLMYTVKNDGNSLKTIGVGWEDNIGTNESGFSSLLAGDRNEYGDFGGLNTNACYWSSTEHDDVNARGLELYFRYNSTSIYKFSKKNGYSIRLIKD